MVDIGWMGGEGRRQEVAGGLVHLAGSSPDFGYTGELYSRYSRNLRGVEGREVFGVLFGDWTF